MLIQLCSVSVVAASSLLIEVVEWVIVVVIARVSLHVVAASAAASSAASASSASARVLVSWLVGDRAESVASSKGLAISVFSHVHRGAAPFSSSSSVIDLLVSER